MILQTPDHGQNIGLQTKIKTAPTVVAVTLTEIRDLLKKTNTTDDDIITELIVSATRQAELYTKSSFLSQVLLAEWEAYGSAGVELPFGPHISVDFVNRVFQGELTLLDSTEFYSTGLTDLIVFPDVAWKISIGKNTYGLRVEYTAGYGTTAADVPSPIKEAIKRAVITNYEFKRDFVTGTIVARLPNESKRMLDPYIRRPV